MPSTAFSLLEELQCREGQAAWQRLFFVYEPLLKGWLDRYDVQAADADDLVQEVLLTVTAEIARFDHNGREGAFRSWLKNILVNRLRSYWREQRRQSRQQSFDQDFQALADPTSELSRLWNQQHDEWVMRRLLLESREQVAPKTWAAFHRVTLESQDHERVAAELGMSLNAVFIAKSRVLSRLRQATKGLTQPSEMFFKNP